MLLPLFVVHIFSCNHGFLPLTFVNDRVIHAGPVNVYSPMCLGH